jgi:hypothetical protein
MLRFVPMAAAYNTVSDFYVRNSIQIRTKQNSVFCGVRILVISCHNGLLIPLPETPGARYVSEFGVIRILECKCGTHIVCCVISPRGLRQHPLITHISVSAAKRMNIHTKWDKHRQYKVLHFVNTVTYWGG